jgi:hypothetical protein
MQEVLELDAASLLAPMRPKVHAALAIHNLLPEVETLVYFSSASSVIGSPRLGHYAAANAFLDAMAGYGQRQGRRVLSIDWGLWSDVGYIERLGTHRGPGGIREMKAIAPRDGTLILGELLRGRDVRTLVWPSDWEEWSRLYPEYAKAPLVAEFAHARAKPPEAHAPERVGLRLELGRAPSAERVGVAAEYLSKQIGALLHLPVSELSPNLSIERFGFDSLLATQLKTRIRQDLEVEIPVIRLLGSATIQSIAVVLVDRFVESLKKAEPGELSTKDRTISKDEAAKLLGELDRMTGANLDDLLERLS